MKLKEYKYIDVFEVGSLEGSKDSLECFGGGKASTPAPVYTAPQAAPQAEEEATMTEVDDETAKTKEAKRVGAKSLQIPVTEGASSTVIGTGN